MTRGEGVDGRFFDPAISASHLYDATSLKQGDEALRA
jgi:hypothetical protein